jgi:hypothetical protein
MDIETPSRAGYRPHPSNGPDRETHCFYCRSLLGEHKPDCVCVKRTVVIEMKAKMVLSVPRSWTEDDILFHLNESSHCASNEIRQLYEESIAEENVCNVCSRTEFSFVQEASLQDHENMSWRGEKGAEE